MTSHGYYGNQNIRPFGAKRTTCNHVNTVNLKWNVEYKLNRDFDKISFYKEFGQNATFPKVKRNDVVIGGCTETVKYLRENNYV